MKEIAAGVHVLDRSLRFMGIEVGTRMTVINVGDGLLVHSPVDIAPSSLSALGQPRWVLAPNKLHHLYVGPWVEAGVEGWAAPGLAEKRPDVPFAGVPETGTHPFGPDVEILALSCFSFSNEVVVFHKPSKTLVVTDLVFNFPPTAPWFTRAAMCCAGGYPGCRATLLERVLMNRTVARQEITAILEFDFDRVVMSHGDVIESGGRDAFAAAYRWLGIPERTNPLS